MAAESSAPMFDPLESPSRKPNGWAGKEMVLGLEAERPSPSEIKPENLSEPWCLQRPKRRRGRPVGPVSKLREAEVPTLEGDESHIKEHSRAIYVVSAIGRISRVAIRHAGSGNVHLLQGDLDIIFLTGVCLPNWIGQSGYTGGLKACLQTPTGENVTGLIGDTLIAGSTVQVVFLSFSIDHRLKGKKRNGAHLKGKKRNGTHLKGKKRNGACPTTKASAQVS
ncbi:PPC domain [Dillenia turbinata]|uniref:AT-hook motif nuclear-localized protein n=1 Tax=Dillenia turbinata TaxID=194707 RepID=A0AAN8YXI1_9MAGN